MPSTALSDDYVREFLNHLRQNNSELSAFWMSYVDMVEGIVLGLLRVSREGGWDLHLHSIQMMIPWCFAHDKVNYSRYLTPYFAQMTNLSNKNPEVQKAFKEGTSSVQLASSNPFGRIPVDQTTEVTVNKNTQNPGRTTSFSLKHATVQRYYLTAEYILKCISWAAKKHGTRIQLGNAAYRASVIKKKER